MPLPIAATYSTAPCVRTFFGHDMIAAATDVLDLAILDVAKIEAPVHVQDLAQRVASRWGHATVGTRMMDAIKNRLQQLERQNNLSFKNNFIYLPGANAEISVRSRAGTNIPAERISPEEHREAVLSVLAADSSYDREELIRRVRSLFGYSRTGNQIRQQVGAAIDALLKEDRIGEGSTGLKARNTK
jgi:hypothetical protein